MTQTQLLSRGRDNDLRRPAGQARVSRFGRTRRAVAGNLMMIRPSVLTAAAGHLTRPPPPRAESSQGLKPWSNPNLSAARPSDGGHGSPSPTSLSWLFKSGESLSRPGLDRHRRGGSPQLRLCRARARWRRARAVSPCPALRYWHGCPRLSPDRGRETALGRPSRAGRVQGRGRDARAGAASRGGGRRSTSWGG